MSRTADLRRPGRRRRLVRASAWLGTPAVRMRSSRRRRRWAMTGAKPMPVQNDVDVALARGEVQARRPVPVVPGPGQGGVGERRADARAAARRQHRGRRDVRRPVGHVERRAEAGADGQDHPTSSPSRRATRKAWSSLASSRGQLVPAPRAPVCASGGTGRKIGLPAWNTASSSTRRVDDVELVGRGRRAPSTPLGARPSDGAAGRGRRRRWRGRSRAQPTPPRPPGRRSARGRRGR